MGGSVSRILSGLLWTKKEIRILILGLASIFQQAFAVRIAETSIGQRRQDDASLSIEGAKLETWMRRMDHVVDDVQIGEVVTTIPTIGFNVESVIYKNLNFNVWVSLVSEPMETVEPSLRCSFTQDLGGQTSIRPYWRCYYANTAAVIFVIDSTDIERLGTASEELAAMLNEEELRDAALLVFANKQDQPGAKGAGEISEALQLGELRDRNWSIVACSAVDGRGINEGMDWLVVSNLPDQSF